jgi:SAM-dependent methyltransferase
MVATAQRTIPSIYEDGTYLQRNPEWHIDESPWKANQILSMICRQRLVAKTICDVGCGVGEVLRLLQKTLPSDCDLWGYEVSPQAYELCGARANERLHFKLMDIGSEADDSFDLLLLLDVIEHVEDYFSLLRTVKHKARMAILHIPLDLSVQTVLRKSGLVKRRNMYAHLHYFTKETALRTLEEVGYEIVDYFYTPRSNELGSGIIQTLLRLPRRLCFAIDPDFAVRVLGGYSLLVLAKLRPHVIEPFP